MAKKEEKNRGFDVSGTAYNHDKDLVAQLIQVFSDISNRPAEDYPGLPNAVGRFMLKRTGDRLMIEYHLQDTFLNDTKKTQGLVQEAHKAIATLCTQLKKEFKKRTKTTLDLKEHKDSAGYHLEQVSLNGRWYLRTWRMYDVSPEATAFGDED